jgi:hypothetical protein
VASPDILLERLDAIAQGLAARGDAIALLAVGSVGRDLDRLDEHSDLDFFVIVDDDAKERYLESIDWLEQAAPTVYDFRNTVDGRKVLFDDDVYAEYAVFTLAEVERAAFMPGRVVWERPGAPDGLGELGALPAAVHRTPEFHVGEALTNLYVGLHRDARGEVLSAMRLIQVYAVDRLLAFLDLVEKTKPQDAFAVERGAEQRVALPLPQMAQGYERNRESALAILEWLESHAVVNPVLAERVRALAR